MDNMTVYKKTIGFSLRRMLWDLIAVIVLAGCCVLGFMIANKSNHGIIGLLIGALVAIVILVVMMRWVSYKYKAGQIAMMVRGVTEGNLPDDVIGEGKKVVKERFVTVAAFFAVTGVIKAIFNEIGRAITRLGESIGGDTGSAVGGAVSSVISTIVNYLCDCCLGWVFYRKDVKSAKATCEGAVLFFKHGKTFAKNMGRVFGIGLVSLVLIGGPFTGLFYWILSTQGKALSGMYASVAQSMAGKEGFVASLLQNPATLPIVFAAIGGLIVWAILHSVFIRPFVLTGVLRNYLESGMNDIPSEESFAALDSKSEKFRKLHSEI